MDTFATVEDLFTETSQGSFIRPLPIKEDQDDSQPFDREAKDFGFTAWLKGNIKNKWFTARIGGSAPIKNLSLKIDSIRLREKWIDEGINPPTVECKSLAKSLVSRLYEDFSIIPERISATVEEGIFTKYTNYANNRELSVEIYNDLDMVALITKNDDSIACKEITFESLADICKIFNEK